MGRQNPRQALVCASVHAKSGEAAMAKCRQLLEGTRRAVPFEHILISGLDLEGFRIGTGTILTSSFPPDYVATYYEAGHLKHDPLVKLTMTRSRTVSDEEAWVKSRGSRRDQALLALMKRHGIRNRTVVPLSRSGRTYGSVVVTSARPLTESQREYLQFVAEPLHRMLSEPHIAKVTAHMGLTQGELRCIELASHGLTSEGIAEASGYAFETVNSYLKSATRKLGAENRPHAVAEALRRRLIS
jgi:DNA-binding CsgD family transcriptional regulator